MSNDPHLLPNFPKGQLFIVSAPSGTGKSTLIHRLVDEFPRVVANVSFTTRSPRVNEIDGVNYYFVTEETFEAKKKKGDFLETVELYGVHYGTCLRDIQEKLDLGKIVILVIDTQGMMFLSEQHQLDFTSIFIRPPSLAILKERLQHRHTDTPESIQKRLSVAEKELKKEKFYDFCVVNDDINAAYEVLRSIFIAENHKLHSRVEVTPNIINEEDMHGTT